MKIIPAIDIKGGKCVRLLRGDFAQITEYSDRPADVAREFSDLKVGDLHVVDLDGARAGVQRNRAAISEIIANTRLDLQLGGGIRSASQIAEWLKLGVNRCIVGSVAVTDQELVRQWLLDFGAERIVLAFDVRLGVDTVPYLTTHGWTKESDFSLWQALDSYASCGLTHVLCTDVSRDGALSGPNVGLYAEILRQYPDLALQASGGVRNVDDLAELRAAGIPAAITGRAILDGRITPSEITSFRQSA